MIYRKSIINKTIKHVQVGIILRGRDVNNDGQVLWSSELGPGARTVVDLADSEHMPFVNGLWLKVSGQPQAIGFRPLRDQDAFDHMINTNDSLEILSFATGTIEVNGWNH